MREKGHPARLGEAHELGWNSGSCSKTSRPAPAISRVSSMRISTVSSMTSPRAVLTTMADGRSSLSLLADSKVIGAECGDSSRRQCPFVRASGPANPNRSLPVALPRPRPRGGDCDSDRQAEAFARRARAVPIRPIPDDAEALAGDTRAEHPVGAHPAQSPGDSICAFDNPPGTARISAMVMSAVSSVRTPGVFVTVMLRWSAAATSM